MRTAENLPVEELWRAVSLPDSQACGQRMIWIDHQKASHFHLPDTCIRL